MLSRIACGMNCAIGTFVAIQFMERSEKSWRIKFIMRQHQFIYKNGSLTKLG